MSKRIKRVIIAIRIEEQARRDLKSELAKEGDTISAFIRRAITERLKLTKKNE